MVQKLIQLLKKKRFNTYGVENKNIYMTLCTGTLLLNNYFSQHFPSLIHHFSSTNTLNVLMLCFLISQQTILACEILVNTKNHSIILQHCVYKVIKLTLLYNIPQWGHNITACGYCLCLVDESLVVVLTLFSLMNSRTNHKHSSIMG